MNTSEQDTIHQAFLQLKLEAEQNKFTAMYPEEPTVRAVTGPHFGSNMWDNPKPGEFMRYWSWIDNNGTTQGSQMTITAFVGPGCLYADAVDGIAARDTGWPMLSSAMFGVKVGARVKVEMGHRLPSVMLPGVYVLNLLLWELNIYSQPARLWDRMHLRFEVTA